MTVELQTAAFTYNQRQPSSRRILALDIKQQVIQLLIDVLSLQQRAADITPHTLLMGAMPEFDSMAAVAILTGLEECFGFTIHDDEIEGSMFESAGSLIAFVERKLGQ